MTIQECGRRREPSEDALLLSRSSVDAKGIAPDTKKDATTNAKEAPVPNAAVDAHAAQSSVDFCENAAKTPRHIDPSPRGAPAPDTGPYIPPSVFSCVKEGGLCVSAEEQEELENLESARQRICKETGLDPMRTEPIQDGPAIGVDHEAKSREEMTAALENLELMSRSAFGAAGYVGAKAMGATEPTARAMAHGASVLEGGLQVGIGVRSLAHRSTEEAPRPPVEITERGSRSPEPRAPE